MIHYKQLCPPERATVLDLNNEHHTESLMSRGMLHVAKAGLSLNFTEKIHNYNVRALGIILDVKQNGCYMLPEIY